MAEATTQFMFFPPLTTLKGGETWGKDEREYPSTISN